jgi:hypothetical protein
VNLNRNTRSKHNRRCHPNQIYKGTKRKPKERKKKDTNYRWCREMTSSTTTQYLHFEEKSLDLRGMKKVDLGVKR